MKHRQQLNGRPPGRLFSLSLCKPSDSSIPQNIPEPGTASDVGRVVSVRNREGFLLEKTMTALCLTLLFWAVFFGGPIVGKGARLSGDVGTISKAQPQPR
jgi:hypothetical protein